MAANLPKCQEQNSACIVQFGHLFAKGHSRESAIRAMVVALKQVKIRGEIRTTVDYTTDMIQHEAFMGNNHHTGWLDSRIAAHVSSVLRTSCAAMHHSADTDCKHVACRKYRHVILISNHCWRCACASQHERQSKEPLMPPAFDAASSSSGLCQQQCVLTTADLMQTSSTQLLLAVSNY